MGERKEGRVGERQEGRVGVRMEGRVGERKEGRAEMLNEDQVNRNMKANKHKTCAPLLKPTEGKRVRTEIIKLYCTVRRQTLFTK